MKKLLLFFFIVPDIIVPYTPTTALYDSGAVGVSTKFHL